MSLTREEVAARVEEAPAKVNLALHVVGRRADGYHLLDSLVAFAAVPDGDSVSVTFGNPGARGPRLTVSGPFAASVPSGDDNLVLAAARACGSIAAVHLHKGLPVAAGIGGGSADAAAVLRAFAAHHGARPDGLAELALSLGADVPVCLAGRACRMAGIGERLTPVVLPVVPALLVNCGWPLATGEVFGKLERRDNEGLPPIPSFGAGEALANWLRATRNDLEPPARALAPAVGDVVAALECLPGCLIARMSGSGATVFALFTDVEARDRAFSALREGEGNRAGWWIRRAELGAASGSSSMAGPSFA